MTVQFNKFVTCAQRDGNNQIHVIIVTESIFFNRFVTKCFYYLNHGQKTPSSASWYLPKVDCSFWKRTHMLQEQGSSLRRILRFIVSDCKCWYRLHNEKVYWMLITFPSYMFSHCIVIRNYFFFHTRRLSQTCDRVDDVCLGFRRPAFAVVVQFQKNWKLKKKSSVLCIEMLGVLQKKQDVCV